LADTVSTITLAGAKDADGAVIGRQTLEQISATNEKELNENLARIFAGSNWEVTANPESDGSYTYFFREKSGDTRPVTLITSKEPPLVLRSGASGVQDVFMIPMPVSALTKAEYDDANRRVSFEDNSAKVDAVPCELPGYFAVGLRGPVKDQSIDKINSHRALPIGNGPSQMCVLVNILCLVPSKKPDEEADIDVIVQNDPWNPQRTLVFDMSGSVKPTLYFELFREVMIENIFDSAVFSQESFLKSKCNDPISDECRNSAYASLRQVKPQVKLGITFYIGQDPVPADIAFDLCNITGCGEGSGKNGFNTYEAARPELTRAAKALEEQTKAIVPAGQDFPVDLPVNPGRGEFRFYQGPYGQNIAGRLFGDVCISFNNETACVPSGNRQKIVEWSIAEDLPLFLSVSLAPAKDEVPEINAAIASLLLSTTATDAELESALKVIFSLPIEKRTAEIYEKLKTIAFGIEQTPDTPKDAEGWSTVERDRSADAAVAAVLGAWALKGDASARAALFELLGKPEFIGSEEAKTVVARSLALIITDEEAKTLLKKIKASPDAGENSVFLAALAGHEEFLDGLKAMLMSNYHPDLYETAKSPAVIEAMRRIFMDPIIQTDDLDIRVEARNMLAGNNWQNDLLQRVHEEILLDKELSIHETSKAMDPTLTLIYEYAVKAIPRELVKRSTLAVNTDLTKRHLYVGVSEDAMERQGVALANTAQKEEAYLSIRPDEDDDAEFTPIEVGLLESEGSVMLPHLSASELDSFFETAGASPEDDLTMVHWHIHPIGSTNGHKMAYNIPSSTDLSSYVRFAKKWADIIPSADFEFKILTPSGVLLLRPKDKFMAATKDADEYYSYERFVNLYQGVINNTGCRMTTEYLADQLEEYFDVEFKTIR